MVLVVALIGCSSKKGEIDTAKLQKPFATADAKVNGTVNKAVVDIQTEDYASAMTTLQKLAAETKLTPEQQQAIKDTVDQLAKKLGDKAKSTINEMQKNVPAVPK